jgi:diaminohydroxyphosphoribosylaminopyrimidine deaminase / 5-amino-6-(5-phosphoribosylamino)uracil reductase
MMARALKLARRGEGSVEPNPMVGCVVAKDGIVIGQGYHRCFGGPHAEIQALRSCVASPAGTTVYCTLEPCSHMGKTSPCVNALIEAGVARIVIPQLDPNPAVNGRGVRAVRRAGIDVDIGALADDAAALLRPFTTRVLAGRPYVIAKWAQSLNGLLVTDASESRWISGEASRKRVHQLRARVDAIMVGAGTVLRDDPLLTARDVTLKRTAMRWVVDGRLRIPLTSKLIKTAGEAATVVFTTAESGKSSKANSLRRAGVEVIPCRARKGLIDLDALLHLEMFAGVTNLLVEGGPTLLNQLFRANLVDEAQIYVASRLLGLTRRANPSDKSAMVSFGPKKPISVASARCGDDIVYKILYA